MSASRERGTADSGQPGQDEEKDEQHGAYYKDNAVHKATTTPPCIETNTATRTCHTRRHGCGLACAAFAVAVFPGRCGRGPAAPRLQPTSPARETSELHASRVVCAHP